MDRIRIAMIGTRGVPATMGGVERHVEELGARLASAGHDVTVYTRSNYVEKQLDHHRGMRIRTLDTIDSKHLDAIVHSAAATWDAVREGFDVIHLHALGPGLVSPLARARRARVVQTVHGLDHLRAKWGGPARAVLQVGAWMSAHVPHATITVSRSLAAHYERRYHRNAHAVPNGVRSEPTPSTDALAAWGLEPGRYVLFVGRFVPEKEPHRLIAAFRKLPDRDVRLVLAGGSCFTDEYAARLTAAADGDPRIVFPGIVRGAALHALYAHAGVFVLPSTLEGMPLTLLEAASFGVPIIASAIEPHVEVLEADEPGSRLVAPGDTAALGRALRHVLDEPGPERLGARLTRERILRTYTWDRAAGRTLDVYEAVTGRELARPPVVLPEVSRPTLPAPTVTPVDDLVPVPALTRRTRSA